MGSKEKLQRKLEEVEAKKAAETLKSFCKSRSCEECIFLGSRVGSWLCSLSSETGPAYWDYNANERK